jgi:hypothetical protein
MLNTNYTAEIETQFVFLSNHQNKAQNQNIRTLSQPSSGVTYKDVDSDCQLGLFASLTITTNDNYLKSFLQQALHLNLNSSGTNKNLEPGSIVAVSRRSL